MTIPDYIGENCPSLMAWLLIREVGPAWGVLWVVGVWNVLVTHSGWDLAFATDPREHFIHHNYNYKANLGILFDYVFGTYLNSASLNPDKF